MFETFCNKKILVVVAHPDDELLGCGATLHRLKKELDCAIRVVILGEGLTSRSATRDTKKWEHDLAIHRANIEAARKSIGYDSTGIYNFPDNRFDSVALLDLVKVVEEEKRQFQPDVIFTHHGGDMNVDHQRTFEAVMTASRPFGSETVKVILTFETPSSTEWRPSVDPRHFVPNVVIEVREPDLEAKINGMEAYEFERRKYPHPRAPEALRIRAQYWGITVGCAFAEPFHMVRFIG
ncbi:MAG: PIG-L deacetylase family protein [Bacteroidota bacterium]